MDYKKLFRIDIPVEVIKTGESKTFLDINGKRAKIEYLYEDELFEAFAELRMGLDYSPLLTTLFFQKGLSKEEEKYAVMFAKITTPIRKAWAFKNALKYASREIVEKEAREVIEEIMMIYMWKEAKDLKELYERGIYMSTSYLIGKALGLGVKIEYIGEESESWYKYIRFLEKIIEEKPSPYLLTRIPPVVDAPYRVKVKKVPYPHYEIKQVK